MSRGKRTSALILVIAVATLICCSEKKAKLPDGIVVSDGFEVEVAAGPDLVDYPMFVMVDETGRLFVFESTGNVYNKSEDAIKNPQFRINLLEDLDSDGVYDKSTIYADKVGFPQGGVFYKGSLYASSAPDLIKFTDADGDGVAEKREVILSGWTLNVNANSLIGPFMAPDGWLYLTSAIEGFDITSKEGEHLKGKTARVWRLRPDGSDLQWVSAGGMNNPVGLTFTAASEPIGTQTYFTDPKAGQRDALMYWTEGGVYPKPNNNIKKDQLPLTGDLLPVITKYSRVAPAGIASYNSKVFGESFYTNLFSAQFNTHRVLRHKLIRDGASFRTEDEVFFSSNNLDFHPTDVREDGDGSLLVVETGGWFIKGCPLSQVSKPELQGSIYRIRKKGAPKINDPFGNSMNWEAMSAQQALDLLQDERPFVAERAVNWLVDQGNASVSRLQDQLKSGSTVARTRSIFALYRINTDDALTALRGGLMDPDVDVRVAAARCVGLAKDKASVNVLLEMIKSEESASKRQAATALGQIGDASVVSHLLEASDGVKDRFVDHAIIYALISINEPAATEKGLTAASPSVKKTALIALDQMKNSTLKVNQLTPFLAHKDSILQNTALWVVSHHAEWAEAMTAYLQMQLSRATINSDDQQRLKEILVSFGSSPITQDFIARQMAGNSVEKKSFMLDVMAACDIDTIPPSWTKQLGNELSSGTNTRLKLEVIKLVRLQAINDLTSILQNVADNEKNPDELRIAAVGALLEKDPQLADIRFNYLYNKLQPGHPTPMRQQVATVLTQGKLSKEQRLELANNFLPKADAFILPRLMPVFKGSNEPEIGKALITTLTNLQSLDNFNEEYLREMFSSYPQELNEDIEQLMAKLKEVRAERIDRIHAIENQITDGDIERGRILFFGKAICYTCHSIGREGGTFGPDLTSIQRDRSAHDLVESTVYPGVSFVREFETYRIATKDKTFTGIIQEQTDDVVVLGLSANESIRIKKNEILSMEIQEVSMMPQGLDKILSEQEMADLMAFLLGQDQDPETDSELLR
jgi:putative membrane-bound dehydrogenase-like protein